MTPTCAILIYHPRLTQILLTLQNTSCLTKKNDKYIDSESFSLVSVIARPLLLALRLDNSNTVRIRAWCFFCFVFSRADRHTKYKKKRDYSHENFMLAL